MGVSFRRGFCGGCVRVAKCLPVIFIVAVVAWSYYAYMVQLCIKTVLEEEGTVLAVALIVLYHFFLIMFLWSYWQIVFTPPGQVPNTFKLTTEEMDSIESARDPKVALEQLVIAKDIPVVMRSVQGEVRYCTDCSQIKPDRCHHCSVCGECVLKMDHHCPWVNNCVAFQNYKFFILFLGYALTYCLFITFSTLKYFLEFWSSDISKHYGKFHILFLFFVSAMFALSVTSLFVYHLYLVSRNRTTLEAFRTPIFRGGTGPDKDAFHLGVFNNFQEVFGDRVPMWFIPISTCLGDGIVYPQRGHLNEDEEAGLLPARNNHQKYRDDACADELMPMIRTTDTYDDEENDDDLDEWSKVDIKNHKPKFAGRESSSTTTGSSSQEWQQSSNGSLGLSSNPSTGNQPSVDPKETTTATLQL